MDFALEPLPPIFTAHLFPKIEGKLIELLRSLSPIDWEKQTLAPQLKVKDVAAHLLDTQVRGLEASRRPTGSEGAPITSPSELLALINRLNAEGVQRYRLLSPAELISRMEAASMASAAYHQALDPFGTAVFPVSWAGEEKSLNWFNTAREFTERWHHQQQIRVAVDKPGIMTRELYYPVLDCFMRALPYTYKDMPAISGSTAQFIISGECGGSWFLHGNGETWMLNTSPVGDTISEATIPQEIAWQIFTKGMAREEAKSHVRVTGDANVGLYILKMVSIIG